MNYLLPFLLLAIGNAFEHEQALHAKNFKGSSQAFCTAMWLSVYASWGCRIAILLYVGIKLSWVAAIIMFVGSMAASGIIAGLLIAISTRAFGPMGQAGISVAAFLVWPASLLSAYVLLPTVA